MGLEDVGSEDGQARELVRVLLHDALRAQRAGRLPSSAIRKQMRAVCACAREQGLPVERVLVTVKHEWQATAEARRLGRFEATTVLERIVTLCIDEFYADALSASGDGAGRREARPGEA